MRVSPRVFSGETCTKCGYKVNVEIRSYILSTTITSFKCDGCGTVNKKDPNGHHVYHQYPHQTVWDETIPPERYISRD